MTKNKGIAILLFAILLQLCSSGMEVLTLGVGALGLEEWVLPGGLHYSYNIDHGSAILSRYPMNRLTDMITNFGGVLLGCIVLKFWGFRKPAGIAVMFVFCFLLINLPEMLLGDENSPYAFTDRGYYEQYGEEYEAEHNIDY